MPQVQRRIFTSMLALSIALTGCNDEPVAIWSLTSKSPDGVWIAGARTDQWSGPGIASVATYVELRWTPNLQREPISILVMSNESAYPLGVTAVKMNWISSTHLDITYPASAKVEFQAVIASGLSITAHATDTVGATK
jgi:hypothetical protein